MYAKDPTSKGSFHRLYLSCYWTIFTTLKNLVGQTILHSDSDICPSNNWFSDIKETYSLLDPRLSVSLRFRLKVSLRKNIPKTDRVMCWYTIMLSLTNTRSYNCQIVNFLWHFFVIFLIWYSHFMYLLIESLPTSKRNIV